MSSFFFNKSLVGSSLCQLVLLIGSYTLAECRLVLSSVRIHSMCSQVVTASNDCDTLHFTLWGCYHNYICRFICDKITTLGTLSATTTLKHS